MQRQSGTHTERERQIQRKTERQKETVIEKDGNEETMKDTHTQEMRESVFGKTDGDTRVPLAPHSLHSPPPPRRPQQFLIMLLAFIWHLIQILLVTYATLWQNYPQ